MDLHKIYLKGPCHGLYGPGCVVLAKRNQHPHVTEGRHYTIEDTVVENPETCQTVTHLRLREVSGIYVRNTFKVDQQCLNLTPEHLR